MNFHIYIQYGVIIKHCYVCRDENQSQETK